MGDSLSLGSETSPLLASSTLDSCSFTAEASSEPFEPSETLTIRTSADANIGCDIDQAVGSAN